MAQPWTESDHPESEPSSTPQRAQHGMILPNPGHLSAWHRVFLQVSDCMGAHAKIIKWLQVKSPALKDPYNGVNFSFEQEF